MFTIGFKTCWMLLLIFLLFVVGNFSGQKLQEFIQTSLWRVVATQKKLLWWRFLACGSAATFSPWHHFLSDGIHQFIRSICCNSANRKVFQQHLLFLFENLKTRNMTLFAHGIISCLMQQFQWRFKKPNIFFAPQVAIVFGEFCPRPQSGYSRYAKINLELSLSALSPSNIEVSILKFKFWQ